MTPSTAKTAKTPASATTGFRSDDTSRSSSQPSWTFNEHDAAWARDIQRRLPDRLFDAHAHLYHADHLRCPWVGALGEGPRAADLASYRRHIGQQVGAQRLAGGLFFPFPTVDCDINEANRWLLQQVQPNPANRALLLVTPRCDPGQLRAAAENPQVAGVKVYHVYSTQQPTFQSPIEGFIPDWLWPLCDQRGWVLMLHLVRDHALADEQNLRTIRQRCLAHPNLKLVLAHAGRGFNKWDTVTAIAKLRGLENVWFDTSCVCESEALTAIIREFGVRRLMWGSDFPVTERRGKCVSVGERFSWINPDTIDAGNPKADPCPTVLVGLESLRAVLQAADDANLNERDRQDLFHDNAARLLGLVAPAQRTGQTLYQQAKQIIPGGTQLLSKRPEMYVPEQWPAYFSRARGCETWDLDGRRYYDMSISGVGACTLGFADPDVNAAVMRAVSNGSMCTLNPPEEVELAQRLCALHPWANKARFVRTGGEAMAVAVRIARAATGRSAVAICGYHGWSDWYLAANLTGTANLGGHLLPGLDPLGVPNELTGTVHPFAFNDAAALDRVIAEHGGKLAAIVMEPMRMAPPAEGFLAHVKQQAQRCGAVLIFDEITIGWRLCLGGAHLTLGQHPDVAVFAKALGNGYPIGAIIGTGQVMNAAEKSFISSTYWTESIGPVAALATLAKMARVDLPAHLRRVGQAVARSWRRHAGVTGVTIDVIDTCPPLTQFVWKHPQALELKTLYTQLMLDEGFLASQMLYATLAHTDEVMSLYDAAIGRVFARIAPAIQSDRIAQALRGPVAHTGFRRLVS